MTRTVDFYFDVGSPAAYLAWTQLPRLCADAGARIDYRPMLLGGVFQATGNHSPATIPAKGRYMNDDLQRCARRYGVPFSHNPFFPVNTLTLMRIVTALQVHDEAAMLACTDALFRAMWVEGKDMNDPAVAAQVLQSAGFDPADLLAQSASPQVKDRLKSVTQEAVARGVFGAPTFFVGSDMFWGQDRLDFVKQALEKQA
jgi:2-hydroxychromene-2-carboxylate isomerase